MYYAMFLHFFLNYVWKYWSYSRTTRATLYTSTVKRYRNGRSNILKSIRIQILENFSREITSLSIFVPRMVLIHGSRILLWKSFLKALHCKWGPQGKCGPLKFNTSEGVHNMEWISLWRRTFTFLHLSSHEIFLKPT